MSYKSLAGRFEAALLTLFSDYEHSGMAEREDSRAFGAMVEKRMTEKWKDLCIDVGAEYVPNPGRRTIYDFACRFEGIFLGFDVKTKDLDSNRYSDGGVCAVGNLLKFLANDRGMFIVVEFGHASAKENSGIRDLEYIRVAPFNLLPENCYRIENLGTGQVRLNYSVNQIWEEIEWGRPLNKFFDIFTSLAILHYERVGRDAVNRANSLKQFRAGGYNHFGFIRQ